MQKVTLLFIWVGETMPQHELIRMGTAALNRNPNEVLDLPSISLQAFEPNGPATGLQVKINPINDEPI